MYLLHFPILLSLLPLTLTLGQLFLNYIVFFSFFFTTNVTPNSYSWSDPSVRSIYDCNGDFKKSTVQKWLRAKLTTHAKGPSVQKFFV